MFRLTRFLLVLLVASSGVKKCYSQSRTVDSLKLALKNAKHDTTRINVYTQIATTFMKTDVDSTFFYANKALLYTKSLELNEKSAVAYNKIGSSYFNQGNFTQASTYHLMAVDEALMNIRKVKNADDLHRASKILAISLNQIGLAKLYLKEIYLAMMFFKSSQGINEKFNHKKSLGGVYNNICKVYMELGKYPEALEVLFKGLKVAEDLNDKKLLGNILGNIGITYFYMKDPEKAIQYYKKALAIFEETNNSFGQSNNLGNIGGIYLEQYKFDSAIFYLKRSLVLDIQNNDVANQGLTYGNIGISFKYRGDSLKYQHRIDQSKFAYDSAIFYLNKAIEIETRLGNKVSRHYGSMGQVYSAQNNFKLAEYYLLKELRVAEEINTHNGILHCHLQLHALYEKCGKLSLALEHYKLFSQYKDSTVNRRNVEKSTTTTLNYDFQKKETIQNIKHESKLNEERLLAKEKSRKQLIVTVSVSLILVVVLLFSIFIYRTLKLTKKQKDIIETQKLEVESAKHIIEEKHKEITDSINYAERIQRSFLATKKHLDENLPEHFVLFKPKDVVSGDFYWSATLNNGNFILATADSTGHGVPGAIMSLLNITSLEKAIETENSPEAILNSTRKTIIERLKKDGSEQGGKDGMDCSLICFDKKINSLLIANANNPIWIVKSPDNVIEIKGDKMPVGKHDKDGESFTLKTIDIEPGNIIYTLTDGFPDQFGGEKGKKYMSKNLRELLARNSFLPMHEQKTILEKAFMDWVGDLEQVDDVTVIGIRV